MAQSIELARSSNGEFRFFPIAAGRYHVTAEKPGFRSNSIDTAAPSRRPVTLVLLAEPRDRTRTHASR